MNVFKIVWCIWRSQFHQLNKQYGNWISFLKSMPDLIKKIYSIILCYASFDRSDWLLKILWPIRVLQTRVAKLYVTNFLIGLFHLFQPVPIFRNCIALHLPQLNVKCLFYLHQQQRRQQLCLEIWPKFLFYFILLRPQSFYAANLLFSSKGRKLKDEKLMTIKIWPNVWTKIDQELSSLFVLVFP